MSVRCKESNAPAKEPGQGAWLASSALNARSEGGEIMRKTTLFIGIVAGVAMVLLAGLGTSTQSASADNGPHVATGTDATPDKCAGCHRIHTGQNEYLLKEAGTIEDFCYACHGTGGPGSDLAVQEGTFYGGTTPGPPFGSKTASTNVGLRGGGFEEARVNSTDPSNTVNPNPTPGPAITVGILATKQPVGSNHAIDGTAGTMWGNGAIDSGPGLANYTLECTSCHDPHGNGNYRILRTVPTGSGGAGYTIPDTYPKTATDYTTNNYFNMYFGGATPAVTPVPGTATPAAGISILKDTSSWCTQCHTRYLAARRGTVPSPAPGETAPLDSRWDSGDDIFTFRHTSAGWGRSTTTGNASWSNRACITCHASHGSNSQMTGAYSQSIEYPGGAAPAPGDLYERAAMLKMDNRGICRKCHNE
jgi:predicted CXXCH cytochrome family protein